MMFVSEKLCAPAHSENDSVNAALNEFALSVLSSGHINLSIARHFQIPASGTFTVVAAAFTPRPAPASGPTAPTDAHTHDIRRCLAAEFGFPVPALLNQTCATILIPAPSARDRRIAGLLPLLAAAARSATTAVVVESVIASVPEAGARAHELLDLAIRLGMKPQLYVPDQLALEYQITRPGPGRDRLISLLAPLENHPELIQTLEMLVRQGFDRKRSARRLCVHVNTIDYRLRRISAVTGLPVSPDTQWRLFAAFTAHAFVRAEHDRNSNPIIP
ncbi:PucR family transcriptional regulator [Nocardia nova]|uniref:PucR family transcriptional regulator n=1 Tax=Nocardia nova TaxID=37330 RepID=UPI0033FF847C